MGDETKYPSDLFKFGKHKLENNIEVVGEVDVQPIVNFLKSQPREIWIENEMRQKRFKVHKDTESILLKWNKKQGSAFTEDIQLSSITSELLKLIEPILNKIQDYYKYEKPTIQKMMFAKLKAGKSITPHIDQDITLCLVHRIHVPIITNDNVHFYIDGKDYQFKVGTIYDIDNTKTHSVDNLSDEDRIHFIVDYYHE